MSLVIIPSPDSKNQWPDCQSGKDESERRHQCSKRIIKNAQSGAESYHKSHEELYETPLPTSLIAQNAILNGLQQAEARKDTINDEGLIGRDTTKEPFELMVFGPPLVDNVSGRQAKTEESQAKIDNHRLLAQGKRMERPIANKEANISLTVVSVRIEVLFEAIR